MTASAPEAAAPEAAAVEESFVERLWENFKGGNLGAFPVIFGLIVIVAFFSFWAPNFFTPVNFNNIITQMAGTTMLAYGVVFILLLGEIDLSIAYLSAVAGVIAAELQKPDGHHVIPGIWPIVLAVIIVALIGAVQGSFVAIIGVPAFVVTLAGLLIWQGYVQIQLGAAGPIIIQNKWINYTAQYFLSDNAGWVIAAVISALYVGGILGTAAQQRRHGVGIGSPVLFAAKLLSVPVGAIIVVHICNKDRGLPLAGLEIILFLLLWTYVSKRTTFGRHVYAVGGNPEAARRAGISVARIRILVFMISGLMAAIGGIILAARLSSVSPDQGGGTLLLDSISAAVIGGTSLFGGRGEVRSAILGAAVISTISNAMFIKGYSNGVIFMITGGILLFAVTLDTLARRRQAKTGR